MQIKENNIFVPDYIKELEPYKPGKVADINKFSEYKAILCSNENNFGPSPLAVKAIKNELSRIHFYPDPIGEKLISKLSQIHARKPTEVILSNGLDGLLYTLFKAFTIPGDKVISSEFSFVAFNKFSKMNNVELCLIPMTTEYQFDLNAILNAICPKTRIIYICNPNNPTGSSVNNSQLQRFLSKVPESVLVVVDEAYYEFAKNIDFDFPNTIEMAFKNVLSLRTLSKIYGLAGLRIGYGIANEYVIDALKKVKLVFNPNTLAQAGAYAALHDDEHLNKTLMNNKLWIESITRKLQVRKFKFIYSYANFITIVFETIEKANQFNEYMMKNGVLLRKLDGFGMPNAIRISIGIPSEMKYLMNTLEGFDK